MVDIPLDVLAQIAVAIIGIVGIGLLEGVRQLIKVLTELKAPLTELQLRVHDINTRMDLCTGCPAIKKENDP